MNGSWRQSAETLANTIRSGAGTSRAVVGAHVERIETAKPFVNVVVEIPIDPRS